VSGSSPISITLAGHRSGDNKLAMPRYRSEHPVRALIFFGSSRSVSIQSRRNVTLILCPASVEQTPAKTHDQRCSNTGQRTGDDSGLRLVKRTSHEQEDPFVTRLAACRVVLQDPQRVTTSKR